MKCPKCGHHRAGIVETRRHDTFVRRRRKCPKCQRYWYTIERAEDEKKPLENNRRYGV